MESQEGNVFDKLIAGIPKEEYNKRLNAFTQCEEEFTEYLDSYCNKEDFHPERSPVAFSNAQIELRLTE
jgi:hypothetical protein